MKRYIATCNYDIGGGLVKKGTAVDFCEHSIDKGFIRPIEKEAAPVDPKKPVLQTSGHISADQDADNSEDGADEKGDDASLSAPIEKEAAPVNPKSGKSNKKKNGQAKEANA